MLIKFSEFQKSAVKLFISSVVGLSLGQSSIAFYEHLFPEAPITIKEFYDMKSEEFNKNFFLDLPANIEGEWTNDETQLWQERAASVWFFKSKRRSKFWRDILSPFGTKLHFFLTFAEARMNSFRLSREDLLPLVRGCADIQNMILDNPKHPNSWEKKSKLAVKDDPLQNPKLYLRDSWVICSLSGSIASLDIDWPLYDPTFNHGL